MKRRRFTVLDATSVTPRERGRHTEVSRRDDVPCIAVAFDLPLAVCQQRTRQRREHHLTGRHRDWEGFFAGMGRDAPVQPLVDLVTWASTEAAVILLAGRPARPGAAAQRVSPARPGGPR